MVYRVIGLMSGSSLDGLDIVYTELQQHGGKWNYSILQSNCYPYPVEWAQRLKRAVSMSALDYQLMHTEYGHYLGQQVNTFMDNHQLHFQVGLVASHGHTSFHIPARKMTAQLGDGAAIAAVTGLPVVSDLRSLDVALGGQGAPVVPIGEKLLFGDYAYFLNLGGIANLSVNGDPYVAFDISPANAVLNRLAGEMGLAFDEGGNIARSGSVNEQLLQKLNSLDYYGKTFPKSLSNEFGIAVVYPLVRTMMANIPEGLRTYSEHIAFQVREGLVRARESSTLVAIGPERLLCTGGGSFNSFLVERTRGLLAELNIELVVPDDSVVKYKETLIMALLGVLRWREETTVLSSVTGSTRDSVGGAMWMGQEG